LSLRASGASCLLETAALIKPQFSRACATHLERRRAGVQCLRVYAYGIHSTKGIRTIEIGNTPAFGVGPQERSRNRRLAEGRGILVPSALKYGGKEGFLKKVGGARWSSVRGITFLYTLPQICVVLPLDGYEHQICPPHALLHRALLPPFKISSTQRTESSHRDPAPSYSPTGPLSFSTEGEWGGRGRIRGGLGV
jgi:hypothetical protein